MTAGAALSLSRFLGSSGSCQSPWVLFVKMSFCFLRILNLNHIQKQRQGRGRRLDTFCFALPLPWCEFWSEPPHNNCGGRGAVLKKRCDWLMSWKGKASWSHFQCLINLGVADFPGWRGRGGATSLFFLSLSPVFVPCLASVASRNVRLPPIPPSHPRAHRNDKRDVLLSVRLSFQRQKPLYWLIYEFKSACSVLPWAHRRSNTPPSPSTLHSHRSSLAENAVDKNSSSATSPSQAFLLWLYLAPSLPASRLPHHGPAQFCGPGSMNPVLTELISISCCPPFCPTPLCVCSRGPPGQLGAWPPQPFPPALLPGLTPLPPALFSLIWPLTVLIYLEGIALYNFYTVLVIYIYFHISSWKGSAQIVTRKKDNGSFIRVLYVLNPKGKASTRQFSANISLI